MTETTDPLVKADMPSIQTDITLSDYAAALLQRWRLVVSAPIVACVLCLGASYLITPTFMLGVSPSQQCADTGVEFGQGVVGCATSAGGVLFGDVEVGHGGDITTRGNG